MTEQQLSALLNLDDTVHPPRVLARGDWVLAHYRLLEPGVRQLQTRLPDNAAFDLSQLGVLDTAGATLLVNLLGIERILNLSQTAPSLPAERRVLLETVGRSLQGFELPEPETPPSLLVELLANIGQSMASFWQNFIDLLGFIGLTLQALFGSLLRPSRWRLTSLVANIQQIGLNAVPIIMLLTFLVGAVIAFLGSTVLATFGAGIFTVHLVVFSFLREFGS